MLVRVAVDLKPVPETLGVRCEYRWVTSQSYDIINRHSHTSSHFRVINPLSSVASGDGRKQVRTPMQIHEKFHTDKYCKMRTDPGTLAL